MADISKSAAIIAFTNTGATALRIAKLRPNVPIIAACYDIETARILSIAWGIYPIVISKPVGIFNLRNEIQKAIDITVGLGYAKAETDLLTITCGLPFGQKGSTNVLRVVSAAGPDYWYNKESKMLTLYPPESGNADCEY